ADMGRYNTEIIRVREVLNRLISERDSLQHYSNACSSAFAPVRRLPTELLAKIFTLSSPTSIWFCDTSEEVPSDMPDRVAQLHLIQVSQVCSRWYKTVMGTPSLWATIEVDFASHPGTLTISLAHITRSLARSVPYPLTIHLNAYDERAGPGLELLAQHSERWRILDM
ncbi:hypothetical protein B0H19DRAFT_902454, partial [Mycena capillaripes]